MDMLIPYYKYRSNIHLLMFEDIEEIPYNSMQQPWPAVGRIIWDNRSTAAAYNGSWKWPDFQAWTTADKLGLMHDWFERDRRISLAEDRSCTYTIEWHGIHKRESTTKQYFYVLLMQKHILTHTRTHTHTFNTSPKCKSDVPKYLDRRQLIHQI